jgi:hypothetical protein
MKAAEQNPDKNLIPEKTQRYPLQTHGVRQSRPREKIEVCQKSETGKKKIPGPEISPPLQYESNNLPHLYRFLKKR